MTLVKFAPVGNGTATPVGYIEGRPVGPQPLPDSFRAVLIAGEVTREIDPLTGTRCWNFVERVDYGRDEYAFVEDVPGPVNYDDLVKVDGDDFSPAALPTPAWQAGLAGVQAGLALKADTDDVYDKPTSDGKYGLIGQRLHHLDSYNAFLNGSKWLTGQANAGTTLTAAAAANASVLPVNSASLIIPGMQLLVSQGTSAQEIVTVLSVASNNVTLTAPIVNALANGAAVTPLWVNSSHLTVQGFTAMARFVAQAKDAEGNFIITGTAPKVTYLGNSWISQGLTSWATQLQARIPGATVVNAGVTGNTSALMLARFDADVPADSDYVVFNEPGVNDDTGYVSNEVELANLASLVNKIVAIGAIPIYTGHVPLSDLPASSAARQALTKAIIGDGKRWPAPAVSGFTAAVALAPEVDSLGMGLLALLKITTGTSNVAFGPKALAALTTGIGNTALGREAMPAATTGNSSTAVGQNALRALTTGGSNTAIGQAALASLTTGTTNTAIGALAGFSSTAIGNTLIGYGAGYSPNAVAANATTTGGNQTNIGTESGQGSATPVNGITTIGRRTIASGSSASAIGTLAHAQGDQSLALGASTLAGHHGSAALGTDNAGVGASTAAVNEIALGTALHTTRIRGHLRLDQGQTTVGAAGAASALPATPAKYLSIKDSTGTEYVLPVYAKA